MLNTAIAVEGLCRELIKREEIQHEKDKLEIKDKKG